MERRKFMIGMGSLAAGTAAATGTGAFTAFSADRQANINVVNDASGLVALKDATDGDIVRTGSDGELVIDFTADGKAGGVNTNSQYQVGVMPDNTPSSADPLKTGNTYNNPAFDIQNQTNDPKKITVEFLADNLPSGNVLIGIQTEDDPSSGSGFSPNNPDVGVLNVNAGSGNAAQGATACVVGSGGRVGGAILVNTNDDPNNSTEATPGADLSSELNIRAEDL